MTSKFCGHLVFNWSAGVGSGLPSNRAPQPDSTGVHGNFSFSFHDPVRFSMPMVGVPLFSRLLPTSGV